MRGRKSDSVVGALHFENRVPKGEAGLRHNVVRCPARGTLKVTLLSDDLVGHRVHFYGGRSQPCVADPCDGCMAGIDRRWEGYLWARRMDGDELVMLAVSPGAGATLNAIRDEYRTLAGCQVALWRKTKRPNGPIAVGLIGRVTGVHVPPKVAKIEDFLGMMWRRSIQKQLPAVNDPLGALPGNLRPAMDTLLERVNGNVLKDSEVLNER